MGTLSFLLQKKTAVEKKDLFSAPYLCPASFALPHLPLSLPTSPALLALPQVPYLTFLACLTCLALPLLPCLISGALPCVTLPHLPCLVLVLALAFDLALSLPIHLLIHDVFVTLAKIPAPVLMAEVLILLRASVILCQVSLFVYKSACAFVNKLHIMCIYCLVYIM